VLLPRNGRFTQLVRHGSSALAVMALLGCGSAAPEPPAPPTLTLAGESSALASPSAAAQGDPAIDLSITFHPGISGDLGWMRPQKEIPLDLLGGAGLRWVDGVPWTPSTDPEVARVEKLVFLANLAQGSLADTSVILDERLLCLAEVRDVVARERPSRLLLALRGGITESAVACLRSLPVPSPLPHGLPVSEPPPRGAL
jgi:hypothetical protein